MKSNLFWQAPLLLASTFSVPGLATDSSHHGIGRYEHQHIDKRNATSALNSTTHSSSLAKPSTTSHTLPTTTKTSSLGKSTTTTKVPSKPASSSKTSSKPTTSTKKTTSSAKTSAKTSSTKKTSTTTKHASTTTSTTKSTTKSKTTSTKTTSKTTSSHKATATPVVNLAWKGGLSGFGSIQTLDMFQEEWVPYISWYSNYEPLAPNVNATNHTVIGAPMLWGMGTQCLTGPDGPVDKWRMGNFTEYVETGDVDPDVFFGFYEPDCDCNSSSHIVNVADGVSHWNSLIKPLSSRGIKLGSPPMCTQLDQSWLTEFAAQGVTWDITSIHVNKPTAAEGAEVVEYYYQKFGKPVWVSEFTCVNDQDWSSCGNQTVVNEFITEMVEYFEGNPNVIAYGANNGEGVPGVWNLMTNDWPPQLTASGLHYQSVLKSMYT